VIEQLRQDLVVKDDTIRHLIREIGAKLDQPRLNEITARHVASIQNSECRTPSANIAGLTRCRTSYARKLPGIK
jgi:hypothetical protein